MKGFKILIFTVFFILLNTFSALANIFYTKEDFKNIFLREIKKKLTWIRGEIYVERMKIDPEDIKILKYTPYKVKFISKPKIGSNVLILEFGERNALKRVKIWGYVDTKVPVFITKRFIPNKTILKEDDIDLEFRPFSKLPQDVILDIKSALGKQVKVSLKPGTVLRYSYLERPVLIKRNQIIYIVAKGRNFIVKAKGKALQNGREGAIIKVQNLSSKKIIWGRVISSEEVEVQL